jgi:hypothetical protein
VEFCSRFSFSSSSQSQASNFFLYAFTGRVFRHELRRLFTCQQLLVVFSSSSTRRMSSQRLTKQAKQMMLLQNPTQGVHEHFYANGKRHTRILTIRKIRRIVRVFVARIQQLIYH